MPLLARGPAVVRAARGALMVPTPMEIADERAVVAGHQGIAVSTKAMPPGSVDNFKNLDNETPAFHVKSCHYDPRYYDFTIDMI